MEPIFIFVSLRSSTQAVSDEDPGAKSSRKNADGKKHMFMVEQKLYQVLRRPLAIAITGRSGPIQVAIRLFFLSTYVIILTFVFTN
jgi:hypothetical protein